MGFLDKLLGRGKAAGADAMREADRLVDRGKDMLDRDEHEHDHEHPHDHEHAAPETGTPESGTGGPVTPP